MAKTKKSKKRTEPPAARSEASRRPLLLIVGGVLCLAAIVLAAIHFRGASRGPGPSSVVTTTDELALRTETIEVARRLVADHPEDAAALGLMGTVYNQLGNSAEAEKWWRECLARYPGRADVYEALAVTFLTKGEFEKVIELSNAALAAAPEMRGVHRYLAEAFLETGRLDDALAAIESERRINPGFNEVYVVLGRIHLQRKAYAEAETAYAKALELRPGDSRSYFGLATATARLGQDAKSKEYLERFAALRAVEDRAAEKKRRATDVIAPAGSILAEALLDAGRTYLAHGEAERAEASWRRAAAADPRHVGCRLELVSLYRRARRAGDEAEVCAQLTSIDPDNATYHLLLAQARDRNNDRAGARAAVARAAELDPNDEQVRKTYERLQRER